MPFRSDMTEWLNSTDQKNEMQGQKDKSSLTWWVLTKLGFNTLAGMPVQLSCTDALRNPKKSCWSPAPAARGSAWRDERCQREMMQPLTRGVGLHVYFKHQVFFYTLTKASGQRFDIFSSPSPRLIVSLLPFKQSSCFSDSLRILFPCDCIATHASVWAAYHIPQFISHLSNPACP